MAIIHIDKKTSDKSMSDYETMRESKVAYNYINDILENSEIRMDTESVKEMKNALEILDMMYSGAYSNIKNNELKKEQLITDACCKNCNNQLLISDNIDYSYQCEKCDENFYDFEAISDSVWYREEKKEHLELPSSFNLDLSFDKDNEIVYIGTESSSGAKYKCSNADEFIKDVEMYCNNYLTYEEEKEVEL